MAFFGPSEEDVKARMREFYAKDKAERDENRKKREDNRRAAADRAQRKRTA